MEAKPRLTRIHSFEEMAVIREAQGDLGVPRLITFNDLGNITTYADADELRKWRAGRSPPTSGAANADS